MKSNNCIYCKGKNFVTSDMFCFTIYKLESFDCLIEFGISLEISIFIIQWLVCKSEKSKCLKLIINLI